MPSSFVEPSIESLLARVDSKFALVTLAGRRARQINSYFNHLGESGGMLVPPQVSSVARKPLSIAFEEIALDKIVRVAIQQMINGADYSDEDWPKDVPVRLLPKSESLETVLASIEARLTSGQSSREIRRRASILTATMRGARGRELSSEEVRALASEFATA